MDKPPFTLKKTTLFSIKLANVAKVDPDKHMEFDWKASPEDWDVANECADRMMDIARANGLKYQRTFILIDLMTAHCHWCPMHLWRLLASSNDDFTHDVLGIGLHIDRRTGQFLNGFQPRFAVKKS